MELDHSHFTNMYIVRVSKIFIFIADSMYLLVLFVAITTFTMRQVFLPLSYLVRLVCIYKLCVSELKRLKAV